MKKEEEGFDESVGEVAWNLASMITLQIGGLLSNADQFFVNRSFGNAMSNLKAVRLKISSNISVKEMNELDKKEGNFWFSFNRSKIKTSDNHDLKKFRSNSYVLYCQYNDLLMGYLKKYGFLIPNKKDKTNMG